ncbi:MAG: hypothetical protein J5802_03620 [Butyrivibrio sp.]|nr:hypothetical protein [Butyrivibrio sp.]
MYTWRNSCILCARRAIERMII